MCHLWVVISRRDTSPLALALCFVCELAVAKITCDLALDLALPRHINCIRQPSEKAGALSFWFVRDKAARCGRVRYISHGSSPLAGFDDSTGVSVSCFVAM